MMTDQAVNGNQPAAWNHRHVKAFERVIFLGFWMDIYRNQVVGIGARQPVLIPRIFLSLLFSDPSVSFLLICNTTAQLKEGSAN
jgi:hypothetical protein